MTNKQGPQCWFSADSHLGHANIIRYCNRPFTSVQQMDDAIIENINAAVAPNDVLYVLGDFAFSKDKRTWPETWMAYRERIKCSTIILVLGNHDPHTRAYSPDKKLFSMFADVCQSMMVRVPFDPTYVMPWEDAYEAARHDRQIYLHHYACRVWPHSHHGSWHLYGHSHGSLTDDNRSLSFDAGVDCWGFKPISVADVAARMATKSWSSPFARADES